MSQLAQENSLYLSIDEVGLPQELWALLRRLEIRTLRDLLQWTTTGLRLNGVTDEALETIGGVLHPLGLAFGMPLPPMRGIAVVVSCTSVQKYQMSHQVSPRWAARFLYEGGQKPHREKGFDVFGTGTLELVFSEHPPFDTGDEFDVVLVPRPKRRAE